MLGRRYGESDWREPRKQIGLVSSSIRQMMADTEPALETVVSGQFAMIDFWGTITAANPCAGLRLLRQIECGTGCGAALGFFFRRANASGQY